MREKIRLTSSEVVQKINKKSMNNKSNSSNTKKTILLTGAGSPEVLFIIKSLAKTYRIIAVDMDKYSPGLYFAHSGYIVPSCTDKNYLNEISAIVKKEKVDIIIPTIDEEILPFRKYFTSGTWPKILSPTENFSSLCLDKRKLMAALEKANIPCPKTYLASHPENFPEDLFPCIIKPATSRGSRGFQCLENKKDFENYFQGSNYAKEEVIVQEKVVGTEFTISVVVSSKGKVLTVVPKEVILKKGITRIAVTRYNKKIEEVCKKIQKSFHADGPFNVQLMLEKKTGLPKIFEINPRFSTTTVLTMASGVNEVDLLIRDLLGKKIENQQFKRNLVMLRCEEQYFFPENKIKK